MITKAMMADVCDDTNHALGMTLLMSSYSAGLVLGPSIGAFLAFPAVHYPQVFTKGSLFDRYGILLPQLALVVSFAVLIPFAVYILPNDRRRKKEVLTNMEEKSETDLLLQKSPDTKPCSNSRLKILKLTRDKSCLMTWLLCGTYRPIAIAYDELFPVFAATSKKYGGFEFSTANIGVALLLVAIISTFVEIPTATWLISKYGSKKIFIYCTVLQSLLFPVLVILAQISNVVLFWIVLILVLTITRLCIEGSAITIALFLNNSVEADLTGTANGIGMTVSAIGRTITPSLFGSLFSWSLDNVEKTARHEQALGFPFNQYFAFFILAFCGIASACVCLYMPNSINFKKKIVEQT